MNEKHDKPDSLNVANIITASRYPFAICFVVLFLFDSPTTRCLLFLIVIFTILSDMADGKVARRSGTAYASKLGALFDARSDDFFFISVYTCLFSKTIIPFWFFLLMTWTRYFQAIVRLMLAVSGGGYEDARYTTKTNGVGYWIGSILLVGMYALDDFHPVPNRTLITNVAIAIMATLSIIAIIDWGAANRRLLISLFIRHD
jgi:phosphatidylglycerophosphate synthase